MDIHQLALIAHEANRMMQIVNGDEVSPIWDCLEEPERERTVNGVAYALRTGDVGPEDMHDNWCKDMSADGYVCGATVDREHLTHPNLIPFEKLPVDQKAKDALFAGIVGSLSEFVS